MKARISIRGLLGVVVVIAMGLMVWRWNDPAVHFRMTGDSWSFYEVLKSRLKNGDPVEKVEWLLGPARQITDPKHLADSRSYTRRTPGENPQGVEERDIFFSYRADGWNIVLQARDGRLVNFDPSIYPLHPGGSIIR